MTAIRKVITQVIHANEKALEGNCSVPQLKL